MVFCLFSVSSVSLMDPLVLLHQSWQVVLWSGCAAVILKFLSPLLVWIHCYLISCHLSAYPHFAGVHPQVES